MDKSVIIAFLTSSWMDLIVIVLFVLLLIGVGKLLVRYDKGGKIKGILINLCIEAEKYLGSGTGKLKKQEVITWFRLRHPMLSLFVSTEVLDKLIDNVVAGINKYLSDNDVTLDGLETTINLSKADIMKNE